MLTSVYFLAFYIVQLSKNSVWWKTLQNSEFEFLSENQQQILNFRGKIDSNIWNSLKCPYFALKIQFDEFDRKSYKIVNLEFLIPSWIVEPKNIWIFACKFKDIWIFDKNIQNSWKAKFCQIWIFVPKLDILDSVSKVWRQRRKLFSATVKKNHFCLPEDSINLWSKLNQ